MIQLDSSVPRKATAEEKRPFGWAEALFILGIVLYLATRFIALDKFPIYFFSDEAIQTELAAKLVENGFKDSNGHLPIYFENGGQFNLSLSVWLQTLVTPFARSIWLTRGLSALLTTIFPLTLGLALRDFLKRKYWWLAPFVVSVLPAWFLHSRTAFETALGTALFCAFLYFYLRYRMQDRDYLPIALLFGALTFYAYAPLQLVVVLTGLVLLLTDWRYHFEGKKVPWLSVATLIILILPYLLFRIRHPESLGRHLSILQSYWSGTAPFMTKLGEFFNRYLKGLDPRYWFTAKNGDLIRHQMKDMAHFSVLLAPFLVLGLINTLGKLKHPAWRVVLIALLVAPTGAALVDPAITRSLVTLVPFAFLTCIGLDSHLRWLGGSLRNTFFPVAIVVLALLGSSIWMTHTAINKGPLWYQDYGLYGMQWGGKELSAEIKTYQAKNPDAKIIVSPTWANNTDIILSFFLGDPLPIEVNSIKDWTLNQKELDKSMVFILPPDDYQTAQTSNKFTNRELIRTLEWPNGETGFYFVRLEYVENVENLFEREKVKRSELEKSTISLLDQDVEVTHSPLDIGVISNAFDGNTNTVIRGLEANPLQILLEFSEPVSMRGIRLLVGLPPHILYVEISVEGKQQPLRYGKQSFGTEKNEWLNVNFTGEFLVTRINLSLKENTANPNPHIHIWEIEFIQK